mgnify:CR=1 FL=1
MVDAIKSSTKVKRDEESRVTDVRGVENTIESGEEAGFSGVTRPVSGLKLVEVWRRDNRRLNTIKEESFKNFVGIVMTLLL